MYRQCVTNSIFSDYIIRHTSTHIDMSELFSNVYCGPCCFKVNAEVLGRIERLDESDSGAVLRFVDGSGFCGVPAGFVLLNANSHLASYQRPP